MVAQTLLRELAQMMFCTSIQTQLTKTCRNETFRSLLMRKIAYKRSDISYVAQTALTMNSWKRNSLKDVRTLTQMIFCGKHP